MYVYWCPPLVDSDRCRYKLTATFAQVLAPTGGIFLNIIVTFEVETTGLMVIRVLLISRMCYLALHWYVLTKKYFPLVNATCI